MLADLVRNARVFSLQARIWWLRRAMETAMADDPVAPKRRRRRPRPVTQPEVVTAEVPAPSLADAETGVALSKDMMTFFSSHPALAKRRVHFDAQELIQLLSEALLKRGMPPEKLARTKWMWVPGPAGCPQLFLILPGIEA
jgi:hypothetical protein